MVARLALPKLKRTKAELVETRDFMSSTAGGFSFPAVNGMGANLILDRQLESYSGSEIGYRCVQIISNAMAALDLAISTTVATPDGDEDVEYDTTSPLPQLFNKRPNPAVSAVAAKKIAFEQMELTGQAFFYTPRPRPGAMPTALVNVFDQVTPLIDNTQETVDALLSPVLAGFQVQTGRRVLYLLPDELLWLRYPHPFSAWGAMAPWRAALWAADLDRYAREWQAGEFKNGAKPSGVIFLGDVTQDQAQYVRAQFESQHTGTANAGKHLFLYGQAKADYSRIGRTAVEMGYLESHKANAEDMLHAMGVPIDLVIGQATYDNRHSAWVSLWTDTLIPKLESIQADIDRQLVPDPAQNGIFDVRNVAALQENTDAIYSRAIQAVDNDLVTMKQARAMIGEDPFDDWRDDLTLTQYRTILTGMADATKGPDDQPEPEPVPPQLKPPDSSEPGENAEAEEGEDQQAVKMGEEADAGVRQNGLWMQMTTEAMREDEELGRILAEHLGLRRAGTVAQSAADVHKAYARHEPRVKRYVKRLAEKQGKAVLNKLRKSSERMAKGREVRMSADDLFDAAYWQEQTFQGLEDAIDAIWVDGARSLAEPLQISWDVLDPQVTEAVRQRALTSAASITDTTKQGIADILARAAENGDSIDDMAAAISDQFVGLAGYRAEMIARTETVSGYNDASTLAAKVSGVVTSKKWLTAGDPCPECQDLDGTEVSLDDTFGDVDGPCLHPSCRCALIYVTSDGEEATDDADS
jgi:HK97 family phage portal protein